MMPWQRQTGRTTRMLARAMKHAGKLGIVIIVGSDEHMATTFLLPRFADIAKSLGHTVLRRKDSIYVNGTRFLFASAMSLERIVQASWHPIETLWDHYAIESRREQYRRFLCH